MTRDAVSRLVELQQWVVESLRHNRGLDRDPERVAQAKDRLTGNDRLRPIDQLEIYREQFWLRHTASLVEDFPGLGGILGQAHWEKLVEGYLGAHCPNSWTLRDLGRRLPAYVKNRTELPDHALCSDMARLEWQFIELFDAADCPPLDLTRLAELPPGTLETGQVILNPALALIEVEYPVAELRRELLARRAAGPSAVDVPIPERKPEQLVLYRAKDRRLYHHPVGPEAFALLDALRRGSPLVAACEHAIEVAPEHAERLQRNVGAWFQDWAKRGWIVDVRPAPR